MDKSRTIGEWERMVSGRLYTPVDPEIAKRHRVGMRRCDRFNRLPLWRTKTKQRALERLIPSAKGKNFEAFAPFYCEYGVNIYVGRNCFVNYNSVFLDVAPITLGDNVLIGPNVTRDIPPNSIAAGVPARVLRQIDERDRLHVWEKYVKNELPDAQR